MNVNVSNEEFLKVIFDDEWGKAHVTAFPFDPNDIPQNNRAGCWGGGHADKRLSKFSEDENQYFTISLFNLEDGRAVRRKNNFDACFVIVADDVKEKLPLDRVEKLPVPTYKLLSSAGSEQWAWVLSEPCSNRNMVENLLDGLVSQGLAPDGNDPGMKGVTRYVRLPGGSNTKASRLIEGVPFKCQLTSWEPGNLYGIDELAKVFDIDLFAARKGSLSASLTLESETVKNHPIIKHLKILNVGNDNWLNIECPNSAAHTAEDKTGAAVQVQDDGRIHFQCHHGHCNGDKSGKMTGPKIVKLLDDQVMEGEGLLVDEYYNYIEQMTAKRTVELARALKMNRGNDDAPVELDLNVFDPERYVFIRGRNEFYDIYTGCSISVVALNNSYLGQCPGTKGKPKASTIILKGLDKDINEAEVIGLNPTGPDAPAREDVIFKIGNKKVLNTWRGFEHKPKAGDVSLWLEHAEYLIPDPRQREVVLDFLACIVQRVDKKPAFVIGHRGSHRVGKDLFYTPVMKALGLDCAREVNIDNILAGWGDYVKGLKFCIINEVDKAQDKKVANSMKVVVAPTASGFKTLNIKGGGVMEQRDCMASVMMSNKKHFIAIEPGDERYFIVDSWIDKKPAEYYKKLDKFVHADGASIVLDYLLKRDISNFNHNRLPYMTEGAKEMVKKGRYDYEQDLDDLIQEGAPPFHKGWASAKEIKTVVRDNGLKCGNNGLEEALSSMGWFKFSGVKKVDGKPKRTPTFYSCELQEKSKMVEIWDYWDRREENLKNILAFPQ